MGPWLLLVGLSTLSGSLPEPPVVLSKSVIASTECFPFFHPCSELPVEARDIHEYFSSFLETHCSNSFAVLDGPQAKLLSHY